MHICLALCASELGRGEVGLCSEPQTGHALVCCAFISFRNGVNVCKIMMYDTATAMHGITKRTTVDASV